MSRGIQLACVCTVLLGAAFTPAAADEKKEPSAKAQEAAKLLKGNLAKFSLRLHGNGVKADPSAVRLVTKKELIKAGEKGTFAISEEKARAVIDALVSAGQFDKPQYIPPPGVPVPVWELYVSIEEPPPGRPRAFWWRLGDPDYDLATDPAVVQLLKVLNGDSKTALERLVAGKAVKPR
jgi:hypothetical protein